MQITFETRKRNTWFYILKHGVPEGHSSEGYAGFKQIQPWPWHVKGIWGIIVKNFMQPAPVAQWLARRTVGRKVWGSNPIRVMWDFSALAGSYPELGVLWAQWEGWNHTAELHPLNGCVFEGVALITWPTLQVPQFPGLVNTGIIMTVSVVCGPVK